MERLKEERVGKKSKQQREGMKSKLDHFLRNRDESIENWKRSIKEHESLARSHGVHGIKEQSVEHEHVERAV